MKFVDLFSHLLAPCALHLAAAHGGHADVLHSNLNIRTSNSLNLTTGLLNKAITALGGETALNNLKTYQASAL